MRRLVRRFLLVLASTLIALVSMGVVATAWNDRADDVCREQAPRVTGGYAVNWEWSEFAYVCNYRTSNERTKRVGIIDAFHGEGRRRHRPDR
jgi:hypothetical protein